MYWSKRFYIYHLLTWWVPDSSMLMFLKRALLRALGVTVGNNVQISSKVRFLGSGNIQLGDNVRLLPNVQIGGRGSIVLHENVLVSDDNVIRANGIIEIGARTEIYQSNILMANGQSRLSIGPDCKIAHMVSLKTSHHVIDQSSPCIAGEERFSDIIIGQGCWICAGVIVIPGVRVGARSVLGAGAVVTKDVPSNVLVAGIPATVKKRYEVEVI